MSDVMVMRISRIFLRLLWVLALLGRLGHASEGDRSAWFQQCHERCLATGCATAAGRDNSCALACPGTGPSTPWALQLALWSCSDDCKYHCMHQQEAGRLQQAQQGQAQAKQADIGYTVWKYYGKWPFIRVFGAQEIASVLFSLGNLAAHLHCLYRFLSYLRDTRISQSTNHMGPPSSVVRAQHGQARHGPGPYDSGAAVRHKDLTYPYTWIWLTYAALHSNAWLCSAVFHTRDTHTTERFDYCAADAVVAFSLAAIAVRILQPRSRVAAAAACAAVAAGLVLHMRYMLTVKFDYGWNMKLCLCTGVVQAVAWAAWCHAVRHPYRQRMYTCLLLVHAAMLLEVLDFPPFGGYLDAHALWHATTIPLVYMFYGFVHGDVAWVMAEKRLQYSKTLD
mmetsp:Transcript_13774/g.29673  ORF Transcript_13774/g.29673 Transcript_13774/m.29673 type:complete len:394 (+) Transcript_13774:155-1336(+)